MGRVGELLMLGCVASWATYTLIARRVLAHVPSMTATGYSTLVGALALQCFALPNLSAAKVAAITWQIWAAGAFLLLDCSAGRLLSNGTWTA